MSSKDKIPGAARHAESRGAATARNEAVFAAKLQPINCKRRCTDRLNSLTESRRRWLTAGTS